MSNHTYPDSADLRRLLRFSAEDGRIWLDEHRMILMHAGAVSELRKEIIQTVGIEQARRIVTRAGFSSGMRDAELARKVRGNGKLTDAFAVGPQLHMLQGIGRVQTLRLEMDEAAGHFYGELLWFDSLEAEVHLQEFGPADHPVCWMQIGYASGFSSAFMGRFILFREVECRAMGTEHCRIIGKPVEEWADAYQDTPYYEPDSMVRRMLEMREELEAMRRAIAPPCKVPKLIGSSKAFRHAYDLMERAADTCVSVLLLGETGVGKERFARALHELSARKEAPFVAINCAALPDELIESELFGVERGAYTGAHASRAGKFERADGGTLFLDEIGELPLSAQAKLLRVLQEGEIERLGDERTRKVDVRLVAATNVNLQDAVAEGRFRRDLFYRLNVFPVTIPPLRERSGDIALLVEAMVKRFCTQHGKRLAGMTDKALSALKRHQWPGNVRELENVIERGIILAPQHGWIEVEHLFVGPPPEDRNQIQLNAAGTLESAAAATDNDLTRVDLASAVLDAGIALEDFEQTLLQRAVERAQGNLSAAARQLGMTRPQLNYRIKKQQV